MSVATCGGTSPGGGLHPEVGAGLRRHDRGGGGLRGLRQHRAGADQGHADHQRPGGARGAARAAGDVPARQAPHGPGQGDERGGEHADDGAGDDGGDGERAEQHRPGAHPQPGARVPGARLHGRATAAADAAGEQHGADHRAQAQRALDAPRRRRAWPPPVGCRPRGGRGPARRARDMPVPRPRCPPPAPASTTTCPASCMSIAASQVRSTATSPMPAAMPAAEPTAPTTAAWPSTVVSTWPGEAPTARSSANSRCRWRTNMAKVLAMMKPPTNSEMQREDEQERAEEAEQLVDRLRGLGPHLLAGDHLDVGGHRPWPPAASRAPRSVPAPGEDGHHAGPGPGARRPPRRWRGRRARGWCPPGVAVGDLADHGDLARARCPPAPGSCRRSSGRRSSARWSPGRSRRGRAGLPAEPAGGVVVAQRAADRGGLPVEHRGVGADEDGGADHVRHGRPRRRPRDAAAGVGEGRRAAVRVRPSCAPRPAPPGARRCAPPPRRRPAPRSPPRRRGLRRTGRPGWSRR